MSASKPQPPDKPRSDKRRGSGPAFYKFSGMAIKMAAIIGLGVYAGIKIDARTAAETPWFTLLFSLLAVGIAIYLVIADLTK